MHRGSPHRCTVLAALLCTLLAGGAAQASLLVLDPTTSMIHLDGKPQAPLAGKLETQPFEVSEPLPPEIDEIFQITDIVLSGGGLTIVGPEELEFMGLEPLLQILPGVVLGSNPSFYMRANVELLEVDGDRALFRYLELVASGVGSVDGRSVDGVLTSLNVMARVVETVEWWEKRFVEPCLPGEICVGFPPSIWADETLSERDIGTLSFDAALIPEPDSTALFAVGFALVGWSCRRRGRRS